MLNQITTHLSASLPSALFFWVLLLINMKIDKRRLFNAFLFLLAAFSTLPVVASFMGPLYESAMLVFVILIFLLLLCVPLFLIHNGYVMIRKEGRHFANLLSLLLGIVIAAGEVSGFLFIFLPYAEDTQPVLTSFLPVNVVFAFVCISVFYGSLLFLSFLLYSLFLQILPSGKEFDYLIILGCGLRKDGTPTPLLAGRIEKAISLYDKQKNKPIIIPSGGQGKDEIISESLSIKNYLVAHGVEENHILMEDQSTTTMENLRNSKKLIVQRTGSSAGKQRKEKICLITSDFHVYRALSYAKKLGMNCQGCGARTAAYYYPSAMIREFTATMKERKNLVFFAAGYLLLLLPFIVLLLSEMNH